MNATRTTLLLMGALAGMTFGSVAYAQIAFRNASSAAALAAPAPPTASPGTFGIAFRAAASAAVDSGVTTLTITKPAGTVQNDVMITSIAIRPNTATIALLAGWTLVQRVNNTNATASSLAVYIKVAGAAEPASYAWTLGGAPTGAAGGIQTFSGVDTTAPITTITINAQNGAPTTVATTTPATPSITTTVANTMLVTSHGIPNRDLWANPPTWGGTQGFQVRAGVASIMAQGSWALQAAIGATGTKTATDLGPDAADFGNAHILALRPLAITINRPAGTVAGNVLVASIGFRPNCCDQPAANYSITPLDAGWTLLRRIDNAPGAGVVPSNSLAVYWKVAGAAEPAAYRWSFSVTAPTIFDAAAGGMLKFSGVESVAPISGVEENGQNTTAGAQTTPSINTPAANSMLVTSHSFASPYPWTTPPAGMTEAVDVQAGGQTTGIFYGVQALAGATGTKTAGSTPADDDIGNAHILALRSTTAGTALTIPIPPGTVANDVMIAAITVRGADRTITPPLAPNDWFEVRRTEQTTGTANLQVFYVRAAGASEPASYTWTLAATNTGAVGGILSFSGVDTTAPLLANAIDNHGGNLWDGTVTGVIRANEITANVADTVAVSAHSFVSSANWSAAAPAAEAVDVASRRVPNGVGISLAMYHYPAQALPGLTGNKDATASNDFDTGIGQILTLRRVPPAPAAGGFNAYETSTAPGAITGVIKTKIAGSAISVDMIALNAAKTAIATTFTGTVRVEVLNSSNNTGALDANGCRPTWALIQTLSPDPAFIAGDNGRKTISFTQPNSFPDARLRITFPAGAPTVTGCSNDRFAIRPNTFASFAVTDTDWQTAGTGRALNDVTFGAVMHKAGRPISVRATALNAAGTPAVTTNYTGAPTATLTACAGAACTATFGTLTLATTFAAGQLASDVASYDNVGSFRLELVDSSFASVDAGDSSALEREIRSGTIDAGRFVPDHFAVSFNTPAFGTACGSFTYLGQLFNYTTAPQITVTAQGFANNTTTLYAGSWWRITNTSVTPGTQAARYGAATGTLDVSLLPAVGADPAIAASGSGVGTLTFSSGGGIAFNRSTPVAPFNADIALSINVIDADGVALAGNPAAFGAATPGNGIAFSAAKAMRFGRARLLNAVGSEKLDLPIPLRTEYWTGTGFATNTLDSCTTVTAKNFVLSNWQGGLNAANVVTPTAGSDGNVSTTGTFTAGIGSLTLLKPNPAAAAPGSVDICLDLDVGAGGDITCQAVTPGDKTRLRVLRTNPPNTHTQDPFARAAFGVYGAQPGNLIYFRENY